MHQPGCLTDQSTVVRTESTYYTAHGESPVTYVVEGQLFRDSCDVGQYDTLVQAQEAKRQLDYAESLMSMENRWTYTVEKVRVVEYRGVTREKVDP